MGEWREEKGESREKGGRQVRLTGVALKPP